MSEDTILKELIINTLAPEQFEPITPSETEIYLVEDDVEYASVDELNQGLATKQDVISDLETIRSNAQDGKDIIPQVNVNTQRIEDLTTAKFPNVVIVGTPHIEGGQVSNYSDTSYLQFPFVDISRGQPFDIYFSFTTAQDVTTQQNILDAYFGIALAIQNGKGIMALSSNGTSWDIGTSVGTNTLLPNTTYYVKYSWTGTEYSAALSTDDQTYVPDMNLASTLSPHKTTIFIGGSPNIFGAGSAHPFKGTINFNKSKVVVNDITVWEGMADVGLASRANVSLNNLDEVGEGRFNAKQDTLVSGTNIKTIGGESLLGSGDIEVSSYHPSLLSFQWTDHILNEMSWLRADTFSWQSGDVYKSVYEELENEWNDWWATHTPEQCEQIPNIYPIRSSKGYLICGADREQAIINAYNSTGVAWYYILDTENRRFKLPRTRYGFTGLRDGVGNYVPESLPNITGGFSKTAVLYSGANSTYGSFGYNFESSNTIGSGDANYGGTITFNASRSSSTYQDGAPVQQRATQMYLYFYVGEFSQTAIEQTAGITTEVLNTKADTSSLATVATTGAYSDLSGKPTIPTVDQTYNGTSVNAQSGVAVASAISGKANDTDVVHKAGDEAITGFKTHTANIEMRSTNGTQTPVLRFHIPNVRYTRLIETSNGLEVQEGGGTALDRLYVGASDTVNTVVTTVNKSKGENGYFKLGNGMIVQWGYKDFSSKQATITFPTSFSGGNTYRFVALRRAGSTTTNDGGQIFARTRTATTINIYASSDATGACDWIAIGY